MSIIVRSYVLYLSYARIGSTSTLQYCATAAGAWRGRVIRYSTLLNSVWRYGHHPCCCCVLIPPPAMLSARISASASQHHHIATFPL